MPSQVSSRHSGIRWDEDNTRLAVYVRGTSVAYFDDATADLTLQVNGIAGLGTTVGVTMADDELLALGTNDDVVMWHQSTALSAGVEVANAIVGTSVLADIPANSLIISDITADGDLVFVARTGANSLEYLRADASALEVIVNEASNDIDFRVKASDASSSIFVEGSTSRVGIGRSNPTVALDVFGAITSSGIVSTDEWQTTGGGAVTQGTSKETGFTLNTSTGVITMNNSALGAGEEAVSIWTNSIIDATSVVLAQHALSGAGNPEDYRVIVGDVADGQCTLVLSNLSAGGLSDAVQINFVVIGGASG